MVVFYNNQTHKDKIKDKIKIVVTEKYLTTYIKCHIVEKRFLWVKWLNLVANSDGKNYKLGKTYTFDFGIVENKERRFFKLFGKVSSIKIPSLSYMDSATTEVVVQCTIPKGTNIIDHLGQIRSEKIVLDQVLEIKHNLYRKIEERHIGKCKNKMEFLGKLNKILKG